MNSYYSIFYNLVALLVICMPRVYSEETAKTNQSQVFRPHQIVDLSSWDKGPENRWTFQHISEIIPTAMISRGSGNIFRFDRDLVDLSRFTIASSKRTELTLNEVLERTYTDGFIVLQDGKIVFEIYDNRMRPDTLHLLMSVSKSVTGSLAGKLVWDGRLNPEAKVVEYIPELKNSSGFADATVQQVLDMSTSIKFSENYENPRAEVKKHEQASGWRGDTSLATEGLHAFAKSIEKDSRDHGEKFHYASINTDVLAWLIERASGKRFSSVVREELWSQLGVEHDAQISVDYFGAPVANGGFCMTLRDLARFGQMMLDNGYFNGVQVIPSGWVEDMRFSGNNNAWKETKYGETWPKGFYRNQWYVTQDDQGSFFAIGVNGQHIWINPTTRVVIVKFSSQPQSVDAESAQLTIKTMDALARYLGTD